MELLIRNYFEIPTYFRKSKIYLIVKSIFKADCQFGT